MVNGKDMIQRGIGGALSRGLKDALLQQEIQRRQSMLDGFLVEDRMRQIARQDMQDARQAEQDRLANERYNTERSDRITSRADDQAQRYLANEREDGQRKEAEKQRSLNTAEAAATRYQDAELRRQEADAQRHFQHGENAAQRANARYIAGVQMSGSGAGKQTEGQRKTGGLLYRAQAARDTADKFEGEIGLRDFGPAFLRSSEGKQYRQAASQWIQSVLRDESGAAIGKDEEAAYFETYFRSPFDDEATIKQKQDARDAAEEAMTRKIGGGSAPRRSNNSGGSKYQVSIED